MRKTPQNLTSDELAGITWNISSHTSSGGANCVEAGPLNDGTGRVALRHSHHPEGALVVYTAAEWEAFTAGVRDGEFDF